jgi:hypothetical protein
MAKPTAPISPANVAATGAIYSAAMLDELGLFRVADRVVELALRGLLPVGPRGGRSALEAYRRGSSRRLAEAERRDLYARCFGTPDGAAANRDFDRLWLRFLTSVSAYGRQLRVGNPARLAARREAVRKAGRDLAANLSLHGHGLAPAAASLRRHVDQALAVLRTEAVRSAYGTRDVWEVVDRVSALQLGGVPPTTRLRTRAAAGARIVAWLAAGAARTPTRELVDACELWLAVAGVSDEQVEQQAQPAPAPRQLRPAVDRALQETKAFGRLGLAEQKSLARQVTKVATFLSESHDALVQQVDFPAFVSGLLTGVFDANVRTSVEQMRAYGDLLSSVTKTVDRFAKEPVSDDEARRWLVLRHPDELALTYAGTTARLRLVAGDRAAVLARICADLGCAKRPARLDAAGEGELVAAARRHLARSRQQLLSTMVLMGMNRLTPARRTTGSASSR